MILYIASKPSISVYELCESDDVCTAIESFQIETILLQRQTDLIATIVDFNFSSNPRICLTNAQRVSTLTNMIVPIYIVNYKKNSLSNVYESSGFVLCDNENELKAKIQKQFLLEIQKQIPLKEGFYPRISPLWKVTVAINLSSEYINQIKLKDSKIINCSWNHFFILNSCFHMKINVIITTLTDDLISRVTSLRSKFDLIPILLVEPDTDNPLRQAQLTQTLALSFVAKTRSLLEVFQGQAVIKTPVIDTIGMKTSSFVSLMKAISPLEKKVLIVKNMIEKISEDQEERKDDKEGKEESRERKEGKEESRERKEGKEESRERKEVKEGKEEREGSTNERKQSDELFLIKLNNPILDKAMEKALSEKRKECMILKGDISDYTVSINLRKSVRIITRDDITTIPLIHGKKNIICFYIYGGVPSKEVYSQVIRLVNTVFYKTVADLIMDIVSTPDK
jgi:hypothetical protein